MPDDMSNLPTLSPQSPETPRSGFFQCGVCKKEYSRVDHLTRHVRSHTSDRPFKCDRCGKGFTRVDLLRRHAKGHSSSRQKGPHGSFSMRRRVSKACKSCAASKLRCDDKKPCHRCLRRNQICEKPHIDGIFNPDHIEQEIYPADSSEAQNDTPVPQRSGPPDQNYERSFNVSAPEELPQHLVKMVANDEASNISVQFDSFNLEITNMNAFPPTDYGQWNVFGSMNFDFGLTDEDLEFLDSLNEPSAPQQTNIAQEHPPTQQVANDTETPNEVESNTLHESPFSNWTPHAKDNAYMDQQYLFVPKHLDTPELTSASRPRVLAESLSRSTRDAALALVVATYQKKGGNRIMQCFPSAELLDSLIQAFFVQHQSEIDTWIHHSTIQLNQESPEMILTLAAGGAVLSDIEAIQRLGYAMLEVARLKVNSKYEDNNSLTRDLKQQQENILILQIGLWSGDNRRVEIAESLEQPVVTMLRRASCFKYEKYPIIAPTVTDNEETLHRKWREWVYQESVKRTVHHIFIHDVQASVLLSTNPLMSHVEFDLPMPFSRRLWDAKSAVEWRAAYLQEVPDNPPAIPSMATILQDVSGLSRLPRYGDFQLASLATSHAIATMIIDCNKTRRGLSVQRGTMVSNLWQQELEQELEKFEIVAVEHLQHSTLVVSIIHQAFSLSLYLPLGILETFAGKDGDKRSSDIHDSYIQHISPGDLRQASWHAGQVLRIARLMPPGSLTAFSATCCYFAALALWSLSTVFSLKGRFSSANYSKDEEPVFFLDDDADKAALRRFTVSGKGTPVLSSSENKVLLSDRAAIMRLFQQLLRLKHRGGTSDQQTRALSRAFGMLANDTQTTSWHRDITNTPEGS